MYIYVYIRVYIYIYTYIRVCIYICVCMMTYDSYETIWVFSYSGGLFHCNKAKRRWYLRCPPLRKCDFFQSTPKQFLPLIFMPVVPSLLGDL